MTVFCLIYQRLGTILELTSVKLPNFFGLLKQEIYYGVIYYSYEELKMEIEQFIKYYNEQRIKEKLGWMSPVQYRLHLLAA